MNNVLFEAILEREYLKEKHLTLIESMSDPVTKELLEELILEQGATDTAKEGISTIKEFLSNLKESFKNLGTKVKDIFNAVLKTAKDLVKSPKETVIKLYESIKKRVNFLEKAGAKNVSAKEKQTFIQLIKTKLDNVARLLKENKGKSAIGILAALFVILKLFGGKKEESNIQ